jgi:hypothetical protein
LSDSIRFDFKNQKYNLPFHVFRRAKFQSANDGRGAVFDFQAGEDFCDVVFHGMRLTVHV